LVRPARLRTGHLQFRKSASANRDRPHRYERAPIAVLTGGGRTGQDPFKTHRDRKNSNRTRTVAAMVAAVMRRPNARLQRGPRRASPPRILDVAARVAPQRPVPRRSAAVSFTRSAKRRPHVSDPLLSRLILVADAIRDVPTSHEQQVLADRFAELIRLLARCGLVDRSSIWTLGPRA
jgi:hypothetical protein